MKKYREKLPSAKNSILVFLIFWLGLTLLRAIAQRFMTVCPTMMEIISSYGELYRARLQTIPNLVMAYSLFFLFKGFKVKNSGIVNKIASATLGVYCLHQVPVWYDYLWTEIFKSKFHAEILHGVNRMLYTIICILCVWIVGTVIEMVRCKVSGLLIEDRKFCQRFCNSIDVYVNEEKSNNRKLIKNITIAFCIYLLLLGMIYFSLEIIQKSGISADSNIVEQINMEVSVSDIKYSDGAVYGVVNIANKGKTIYNISEGVHPINLGISMLDKEGNVLDQDLLHTNIISNRFKAGGTVDVEFDLHDVQELEAGGILRFEIVQEGVEWVESTATYWDLSDEKEN